MRSLTGEQYPAVDYLRQQRELQFDVCRRLADRIRQNSNVSDWQMARTAADFAAVNSSKALLVAASDELAKEQDVLYALDTAIESFCIPEPPQLFRQRAQIRTET